MGFSELALASCLFGLVIGFATVVLKAWAAAGRRAHQEQE